MVVGASTDIGVGDAVAVGAILSIVYVCVYIGDLLPARSTAKNLRVLVVIIGILVVYLVLLVVGVVPLIA